MLKAGAFLFWLRPVAVLFLCIPVFAQPRIGGGSCTSATLTGSYSLTLSGRELSSAAVLADVSQGVGSATFDGLSKVTLTLRTNSIASLGVLSTLSGTYSLQANCIGVIAITSGDNAAFTLSSYNQGKSFLIVGEDSTFTFSGNGSMLPASCSASMLSGTYSFNAPGFSVVSGGISGVVDLSGLMQFDGTGIVNVTWYVSSNSAISTYISTGSYTVGSGCTGSAVLTDTFSNAYTLNFSVTSANNFLLAGSGPKIIFTGSGRTL